MKVLLGIDLEKAYLPALHLVARMRFKDAEVALVQASPTIQSTLPDFPIDTATIDLMIASLKEAGTQALDEAEEEARKFGLKTSRFLCCGPSGEVLNDVAESTHADLAALRTTHSGVWRSEFLGSVTRTVVLGGKISTLVAKRETDSQTPIDVVFAVDGSDFNDQCIDKWIKLQPTNIGVIHVVSAWGLVRQVEHLIRRILPHAPEIDQQLRGEAECVAKTTSARLKSAGFKTDYTVGHGTPEAVLAAAMQETGAELLVVAAHGKNWIERLLIGSTSLHEVINEPYNVLVLRP